MKGIYLMGQLKQLHIDCEVGECLAGLAWQETCYVQDEKWHVSTKLFNLHTAISELDGHITAEELAELDEAKAKLTKLMEKINE